MKKPVKAGRQEILRALRAVTLGFRAMVNDRMQTAPDHEPVLGMREFKRAQKILRQYGMQIEVRGRL
jgi:hypothetical protein